MSKIYMKTFCLVQFLEGKSAVSDPVVSVCFKSDSRHLGVSPSGFPGLCVHGQDTLSSHHLYT